MPYTITWWLFWGALGALVYAYVAFPLLAALRALLRPRPVKRGADTPSVSIIIAAYNEAAVITKKLDNVLALDYPRTQLEVIVASDGSDDGTNDLVAAYGAPEVRLRALPRQGKNLTLNAAAAAARGDLLVFTDADTQLVPDALRHLVAPFSDPEVGGVGGERRHANYLRKDAGERTFWGFKRGLKQLLSDAGSMTATEGQLYAVRSELFKPLPPSAMDDFYISAQVVAAHRRLVFEPNAATYPLVGHTSVHAPFRRKVRQTARWLQSVWLMRRLLNPLEYGFYAVQLFSHKLLRQLLAAPLLFLAVTAPMLWPYGWLYKLATLSQLAIHGTAALGFLLRRTRFGRWKLFKAPYTFDWIHVATVVAIAHLLRGERYNVWVPQRAVLEHEASEAPTL